MIKIDIHTQPDDESCGPTCLHAVYQYHGLQIPLDDVIKTVDRSLSGGTLAQLLGKHALQHGFTSCLYVSNLHIFDPIWFDSGHAEAGFLIDKLKKQRKVKFKDKGLVDSTDALCDYLELGGEIRFKPLKADLFKQYIQKQQPIIAGLSATYLYNSAREHFTKTGKSRYDDIKGTPCGHFVVVCGYDSTKRHVVVADPHQENPISHDNYYKVSLNRLINAVLLGVLTYDATLLLIEPKR